MLKSAMKFALGCLLIMTVVATTATAGGPPATTVPEVDPGMMGTAIGVLTAGYLIVSSRLRRK
jgi:hypothetical protein